jgi:hypothetical protein
MNKYLFFTLFCLMGTSFAFAQPEKNKDRNHERIEAMKVAMITKQLELTVEESQKFWPIYNELNAKEQELKKSLRPEKPLAELTEKEAEVQLDRHITRLEKEASLQKEYLLKMKQVLPAKKLLKLNQVEGEFKKRLMNEMRGRKGEPKMKKAQ